MAGVCRDPEPAKTGLPEYNSSMSLPLVKEKVKEGELIEGVLRINPKNYEDAYISAPGGGTDIYIAGVRDRNAALHGDLVAIELLDSQYWKVLYEPLDYFLDCDETLKNIVYAKEDPFATMDVFIPPESLATQEEPANVITTDKPECSVIESSSNSNVAPKKGNKKTRRSNKKKEKLSNDDPLSRVAEEVVAGLLSDPPVQLVQDELIVISSNVDAKITTSASGSKLHKKNKKSKKPVVIVPPDQLSECSDLTDAESCCSDTIDLDTALEDINFFNAQRQAAAAAAGSGSALPTDGTATNTGPVEIVDITNDPTQVQKLQEKMNAEANQTDDKNVKSKPKGRVSVAERLFASKKESPTSETRNTSVQNSDHTETKPKELGELMSAIKIKNTSVQNSDHTETKPKELGELMSSIKIKPDVDVPSKVVDGKVNNSGIKTENGKPEESKFTPLSDMRDNHQPPAVTPPRCMVSPYNQQVNYSPAPSLSRAESNWLQHPMLTTFGNAPPQSNFSSPGNVKQLHGQGRHNQQQQQQHNQQNRNQNHNSPHNRNQSRGGPQFGSSPGQRPHNQEKRTVPSVAQVMRLSNWSRYVQKVGFVVHILEQRNTRLGAGTLKPFQDMNRQFALFSPNDGRIPRMKIPMHQCPPDLFARKQDYAKRIYLAKIVKWTDFKFAMGELVRDIGRQGDIDAESEAFLLQLGIDYTPFPEEVVADLPVIPSTGWTIPPEAFEGRLDLRDKCIFSVDPATARDLDDALSCEALPGDRYKVGVHIADVSYFVPLNSELDKCASDRATSVYLIDRVVPMLPRVLCEQLCSLNPDEERLAFSVIWEMDRFGHVQSTWFGRTIIRSCAKLSYDHAQSVINDPGKMDWTSEEIAPVLRFPLSQVCQTIIQLQQLARHMRMRRHDNGALRLDQRKLSYSLNNKTKLPEAVHVADSQESNKLIEEFMLLANISVAHKIFECFPKEAVLRCHPEPQIGQLQDTAELLRTFDIEIDTSSSGSLYNSILSLMADADFSEANQEVVVNMLSKPMQTALYFCPATYQEDFKHYALNVPFYTHFTSPIRRYPDIMVHRLLAAAVDPRKNPVPNLEDNEIDIRISKANEKKMSAKRASEHSGELYLAEFVRQIREIQTKGVVIGVLDRSLDILLLEYCTIKRTYLEKLPLEELNFDTKNKNDPPSVHVVWSPDHARQLPPCAQSFTYFTLVDVILTPFTNDQLKFNVTLVRPES